VQFDRFRWYPIKVAAELIGDAGAPHAIARAGFAGRIKHLGKSRLPEDGKRHINKSGECSIFAFAWRSQEARSMEPRINANAREEPGRRTDR
jgi:hypothetical protein